MKLKPPLRSLLIAFVAVALALAAPRESAAVPPASGPAVEALFKDWRVFEAPPDFDGAPDYRAATFETRRAGFAKLRARLAELEAKATSTDEQIDLTLIHAEMNAYDFNLRVLQPWARDPAFYSSIRSEQSDTPAHEGPVPYGVVDLWAYPFPLSVIDKALLAGQLRPIPAFLMQARQNLTGNARDLWVTGTGSMRGQLADLTELATKLSSAGPASDGKVAKAGADLRAAVDAAIQATTGFIAWLDAQAPSKTGPSGIGKENYTWSQQHIALLPMTWDDEVAILRRELARAHSSLKLEEEHNRGLPEMVAIQDEAEFQRRADQAIKKFVAFLGERNLFPMRDWMDAEQRQRRGGFTPVEKRNFFAIATHYEPLTLYTHSTHWWDLRRMRDEPNPSLVRRAPLLYNVWAARSEGMATGWEELMLHAGLFDDEPRAKEIVWVMLAQRAARGLASLYLQANQMDLAQAKAFQVEWTPRGWMRPDLDLLGFEQQLYLRQPGYGSSYITGKVQLEDLMRERAHQLGKDFTIKGWFDEIYRTGIIPVSTIRWQLTGKSDEVRTILAGE
ncbi:MAG: DUF885 family protein [Acidobacteriota bacterium]